MENKIFFALSWLPKSFFYLVSMLWKSWLEMGKKKKKAMFIIYFFVKMFKGRLFFRKYSMVYPPPPPQLEWIKVSFFPRKYLTPVFNICFCGIIPCTWFTDFSFLGPPSIKELSIAIKLRWSSNLYHCCSWP